MTEENIPKEKLYTYALLFSICKSAVAKAMKSNTNKTDRIITNSLLKAVAKHNSAKQENE